MQNILSKEFVEDEMRYWKVPGLSGAVIQDGETVFSGGWGVRGTETGGSVTEHTRFGIASCSKSMTSALIAMLVDDGLLDYDTPVAEYIPGFRLLDPVASAQVTLRDMLCHRTGLGGHDGMWPGSISRAEFTRRLRYLEPNAPFRSKGQYSNTVYTLIGHVAECVTGKTWEELIRERIFAPLAMTESSCSIEELRAEPDHAEPHCVRGGKILQIPTWDVNLAGPAASVNSSAADMAKWLSMQIEGGRAGNRQLIRPETFAQMHQPHISLPDSAGTLPGFSSCNLYALGWRTGQYRGFEIQKHMGKIEGFSSIQAYLPEKRIGAVFLMNLHTPSVYLLYTLLYTVFDQLLGLPGADWKKAFHPDGGPTEAMYRVNDIDLLPDPPVPGTRLSHKPEDYAGVYRSDAYGGAEVTLKDGSFRLRFRDLRDLPMNHYHYDTFKVEGVKEDTMTYSMPLTFLTDPETGAVSSFLFRLEPLVDAVLFRRVPGDASFSE